MLTVLTTCRICENIRVRRIKWNEYLERVKVWMNNGYSEELARLEAVKPEDSEFLTCPICCN